MSHLKKPEIFAGICVGAGMLLRELIAISDLRLQWINLDFPGLVRIEIRQCNCLEDGSQLRAWLFFYHNSHKIFNRDDVARTWLIRDFAL